MSEEPTVGAKRGARWFEIDDATRARLDSIAKVVARAVGANMLQITLVNDHRQQMLGGVGIPEDVLAQGFVGGRTVCQTTVKVERPLMIPDVSQDPAFADIPYVKLGFMKGYAAAPIRVGDRYLGTVCTGDPQPRTLDDRAVAALEIGAQLAGEILAVHGKPTKEPGPQDTTLGLKIGDFLDDKYWITAELGSGGQSSVLLARDRLLGQLVAIKLLHEDHDDERTLVDEGSALAQLRHPSIVRVHAWGRAPNGRLYLVLEYLRGTVLAERLRTPVSREDALRILRQLAEAIDALHMRRLIHGDLKPANVILDAAQARAVLIDFGLVLEIGKPRRCAGGTPGYSAPEQFDADAQVGEAADVYALGALAFGLFAGRPPFPGAGDDRVAAQRRHAVPPLEPPALDAIVRSALDPDPRGRPKSAIALVDGVEAALRRPRPGP